MFPEIGLRAYQCKTRRKNRRKCQRIHLNLFWHEFWHQFRLSKSEWRSRKYFLRAIILSAIVWVLLSPFHSAYAQDRTIGNPQTTGEPSQDHTEFRPGHNLTVTLDAYQSNWRIHDPESATSQTDETIRPGIGILYTFHINLIKKFGLVVGTSASVIYDNHEFSDFYPGPAINFPSLAAGFVQNFLSDVRMAFLVELSAAWFPGMTRKNQTGSRVVLSAVPDVIATSLAIDRFFSRNIALHTSVGWRGVYDTSLLGDNAAESLFNGLQFQNTGFFLKAGLTWQLAEDIAK